MTPTPGPRVDVPKISVVVTSHNRAELLAIALRSVQEQDLTAFECIVVDDDSTDDAVSVAQAFAAVDPRFRILVHDRSLGPSAARNAGLAAARAPFVCFLDDDDFLLAGSLATRHNAFDGQPTDVIGTFCDWINTEPEVGLEAFTPRRSPRRRPMVSLGSLRSGAPFILSSPLLRTAAAAVGGRVRRTVEQGGGHRPVVPGRPPRIPVRRCRMSGCCLPSNARFARDGSAGSAVRIPARGVRTRRAAGSAVVGHGPLPTPEPLSTVAGGVLTPSAGDALRGPDRRHRRRTGSRRGTTGPATDRAADDRRRRRTARTARPRRRPAGDSAARTWGPSKRRYATRSLASSRRSPRIGNRRSIQRRGRSRLPLAHVRSARGRPPPPAASPASSTAP